MERGQRREAISQKSMIRAMRVRGWCVMVCALVAVGLLAGGVSSEGKALRQKEIRSTQGQRLDQLPTQPSVRELPPPLQPAQSAVVVEGGRLSVLLKEAELHDVMEVIARQGGIEISFIGEVGQAILTESFVGLPLEEGLVRLLGGKNYALVYSDTGPRRQITQVMVLPRHEDRSEGSGRPTVTIKQWGGAPVVGDGISADADPLLPHFLSKEVMSATDTQQIAERVTAAIGASGSLTSPLGDRVSPMTVPPELNTIFRKLSSEPPKRDRGQLGDVVR